ncbi:MAG: mannitol-1-phosphate 5-dehydrogenase [Turicibacter sp.]|nr:mannitol-1-phosphate 5-dehydrogenase [Turicibacter sp.]
MLAVHFGAGNIGRGFIAPLLDQSGYQVCFVDVNQAIIAALNAGDSYEVRLADSSQETFSVRAHVGYNSVDDQDAVQRAIAEADLITTAVGPNVLERIAPTIAEGLRARLAAENNSQLNIIACENMINGSSILKEHVWSHLTDDEQSALEDLIGFPNSAVDRIVPLQSHDDPLFVEVEPFYEWVINASEVAGPPLEITGVTDVDELLPYIERKLFTVNTGHAACAYLGHYYGCATIKEAMEDARVRPLVEAVLAETGQLLCTKYDFDPGEHAAYITKILSRFENEYIVDEVARVGRSPLRKLGAADRFLKPASELLAFGVAPRGLAVAIAAAMKYVNSDDPEAVELQAFLAEHSVREALLTFSGVAADSALLDLVEQAMAELG